MRGPTLDDRLSVHCSWEGGPDRSASVARLHGVEVLRNPPTNPRCVGTTGWYSRGTLTADGEGGILTFLTNGSNNVANIGSVVVPGGSALVYASYLVQNLEGEAPINMAVQAYTTGGSVLSPSVSLPPGGAPRLVTFLGVRAVQAVSPRLYSGAPGQDGNLIRVSQPVMTFNTGAVPYFDGDTTDSETLMALYAAIAERGTQ